MTSLQQSSRRAPGTGAAEPPSPHPRAGHDIKADAPTAGEMCATSLSTPETTLFFCHASQCLLCGTEMLHCVHRGATLVCRGRCDRKLR